MVLSNEGHCGSVHVDKSMCRGLPMGVSDYSAGVLQEFLITSTYKMKIVVLCV